MPHPNPWRATLSALAASLVGIGLARFAYSPLIPALVAEGWFSASDAAYLGAANLAGYLAGALGARMMARIAGPAAVVRAMMLLIALSFAVCARPSPFLWFFIWRFASGLAGGAIMVLAATLVLPYVPAARRGLAGGLIFMGVGLGVVASGTLLPFLLSLGLPVTWGVLGGLCLVFTLAAWGGWPDDIHLPQAGVQTIPLTGPVRRLMGVYALNAVGLVPHMVFLVDFVVRGLGRGMAQGASIWVLFGLGASVGPVAFGHLGDRIGFRLTLRLALTLQTATIALAAFTGDIVWLAVSGLVIGSFTPGIVPVVLGRIRELLPHDPQAQRAAWSRTTAAFALGQAGGAYGLSWLFADQGSYPILYTVGAAIMGLALIVELLTFSEGKAHA
ncbi:MAG: YbfB/YjiJ family MFS transporter [Magnetospirillum sp.]|nr:YbfB/YjiJ family MFS transporter [Magnetospirillum sp.]